MPGYFAGRRQLVIRLMLSRIMRVNRLVQRALAAMGILPTTTVILQTRKRKTQTIVWDPIKPHILASGAPPLD